MIINRIIPRLLLFFCLVSPIPLASLAWLYISSFESALQTAALENLSSLADKKADQISHYFSERLADVQVLAKLNTTREALQKLSQPDALGDQVLEQPFRSYFLSLFDNADFYDLLLIDVSGNVLLSILHEPDFGSNLNEGPFKDSILGHAQRDAVSLMDTQITSVHLYGPSANKPASFIVTPVMDKGKVIGTVALQLDLERLVKVAVDATGLGRTGETVLAQMDENEVLYVGPLRHIAGAAFNYHLPFERVATAMQAALTGGHGRGLVMDYAGNEVAAVWRYMPALRWGMVVKLDKAEAFQSAEQIRKVSLFALVLLLFLAGILGLLMGFGLVRPIRQLILASGLIARGDLNQRVQLNGCDEFQRLAESFNVMADSLTEEKAMLEQRVLMRTHELQQSNLKYDQLTARIPIGVYVFRIAADGFMGLEYVSDRFCLQFGMSRDAIMEDVQTIFSLVHPDDFDGFVELNRQVGQTLEPFMWEGRFIIQGATVWYRIESTASLQENGDSLWSGVVSDITERKQFEEALIEAKRIAEQANLAKSAFLANMSHEIRTPMNAVLGLIQLVLETELDSHQADFLRKAHHSAKALLDILNDILDYSKIESGRLDIERMPLQVEKLLKDVADLFGIQLEEKGLELFIDISADVPNEVLGDPLRLKQVLNNLLGNAIKFTDKGEIHIRAEVLTELEDGLMLRFAVRDTGIGLSKSQADRLFQPFIQADGSITRKYGGTGLGLAICQKLVNLMGGEIAVSGIEGQGTTFTFTLQAGRVSLADTGLDLDALKCLKVLVADDQETSRVILKRILEAWRLEVETVTSGEAALAKLFEASQRQSPFDAVLLDWRMPGMDGLEVAKRLQAAVLKGELNHPLLVVMVTAHEREALLAEAGSIQLNGVLAKPVLPSYLFDILMNGRNSAMQHKMEDFKKQALSSVLPRFEGLQVLLVEDNAINQQVAAEFLKKRGLIVTLANQGQEALEWVVKQSFDLILMDLHMPVMDGIEATQRIRQLDQGKQIPVIAMTAAVMQEDKDRCLAAGMVDFVAKPIDSDELIRTLIKWLPGHGGLAGQNPPQKSGIQVSQESHPPCLDFADGLHRLEGDQVLFLNLLSDFIEEHHQALSQLDLFLNAGENHQASEFLHKMKGVAANLGAKALAEAIQRLEQELISGGMPSSLQAFKDAFEAALMAMKDYIQMHRNHDSSSVRGRESASVNLEEILDPQRMMIFLERMKFFLEERELIPDDLLQDLDRLARHETEGAQFIRLKRQIDRFDHAAAFNSVAQLMMTWDLKAK